MLRDRGPERVILAIVEWPEFEWVVSADILQEYREVLARPKFALPAALLQRWVDFLSTASTTVDVQTTIEFPRDRFDAKFLECALSAGAEFLITGDRDFENAERLAGTTIVSAGQFERLILGRSR